MNLDTLGILFIIVLISLGAGYICWKRVVEKKAQDILIDVMPIWASFGPYESGYDSGVMLYLSYWGVFGKEGKDKAEKKGLFEGHKIGFDKDPDSWEDIRKKSLKIECHDLEGKKQLVKDLFRLEKLKNEENNLFWDDYYEIGEHLNKAVNDADVALYKLIYNAYENDPQIKINTDYVINLYTIYIGIPPDKNLYTGLLWNACSEYSDKNPDTQISKDFISLYSKSMELLNQGG